MRISGAVIDTHSGEAFMALAASEGLLRATRPTDGVFERICRAPIDYHVREQLLEQLVLTPTLAIRCNDYLWDALDGPLKDNGHLIRVDDPTTDPLDQIERLSLDLIAGLVRAAGHDIPVEEFRKRAFEAQEAVQEQEEYVRMSGREAPSLLQKFIVDSLNRGRANIPYDYSIEEYEAQRRRDEKYRAFVPISAAIAEYATTAHLASKHSMLLKTPVFSAWGQTQVLNPQFVRSVESDELVLFRIVANELGRTTRRDTVSGCLKLATDPATIALREQIPVWQASLARGDERALESVQQEIKSATTALSKLSNVEMAGTLTSWLSVPVSVAELLLALPPVLGISLGVVGTAASGRTLTVQQKYKWASFGGS